MSRNRVIGCKGAIPWHLPEDFKWFKRLTLGHILVMGRKTFESIGRPLPGRETIVFSRTSPSIPGVHRVGTIGELDARVERDPREVFVAGGGEIYGMLLHRCSELFLTRVQRDVEGDAFFPAFEAEFEFSKQIMETPEFQVEHHVRKHRNPK